MTQGATHTRTAAAVVPDPKTRASVLRYLTQPRAITEIQHWLAMRRYQAFGILEYLIATGKVAKLGNNKSTKYVLAELTTAPMVQEDKRDYAVHEEIINGDPTNRVVRFGNQHKPGKGIRAIPRGLGGHSSLERV